MKFHTLVAVTMFPLGTIAVHADTIRLADGTLIEGQIVAPAEVIIKTATGDRKVAFSLLPAEFQKIYAPKSTDTRATAEAKALAEVKAAAVSDEDLSALANEVNLDTWQQVAAIGSFRDKAEKRGTGGLIVTKAFNALDENWVTVYSPKDAVGEAWNWNDQVARAKAMLDRSPQFMQRRWLELFIKAGEAVERRDSNDFAQAVRDMKRNPIASTGTASAETNRNFFPAK